MSTEEEIAVSPKKLHMTEYMMTILKGEVKKLDSLRTY